MHTSRLLAILLFGMLTGTAIITSADDDGGAEAVERHIARAHKTERTLGECRRYE